MRPPIPLNTSLFLPLLTLSPSYCHLLHPFTPSFPFPCIILLTLQISISPSFPLYFLLVLPFLSVSPQFFPHTNIPSHSPHPLHHYLSSYSPHFSTLFPLSNTTRLSLSPLYHLPFPFFPFVPSSPQASSISITFLIFLPFLFYDSFPLTPPTHSYPLSSNAL